LHFTEGFGVFLALMAETAFLDAQVIELALIDEERFGVDQGVTDGLGFIGEEFGEFEAGEGVDPHFKGGNAQETPFGVGQGLDEILFGVAAGGVALEEGSDMRLVSGGVVARQQDGAA
jgi:hypothetical protein